jgi:hypothetical protein
MSHYKNFYNTNYKENDIWDATFIFGSTVRLNKFYLFIKPKWARSVFILILPGSVQRVKEVSKNPSGIEGKKVIV